MLLADFGFEWSVLSSIIIPDNHSLEWYNTLCEVWSKIEKMKMKKKENYGDVIMCEAM